jgi:hypothetical protein
MNIRRASAITLRQIYLLRGSATRVASMGVWVAIDMILWGFITKYLNSVTHEGGAANGMNFVPLLLGAVLLWDYFTRVMQGITTAFFEDVWSHNFLNTFATPLTLSEYLTGFVASSIVTSSFGLVLMLVLTVPLFHLSFFSYGILLVPFLLDHLADSVFALAACGRVLPAFDFADAVAISRATFATIVCIRKYARDLSRKNAITRRACDWPRTCECIRVRRRATLEAHLPQSCRERPARAVWGGECGVIILLQPVLSARAQSGGRPKRDA